MGQNQSEAGKEKESHSNTPQRQGLITTLSAEGKAGVRNHTGVEFLGQWASDSGELW